MTPIDFTEKDVPKDPEIYAAVQEFHKKEFGCELKPAFFARVWAVLAYDAGRPGYFEVLGVTAIRTTADCSLFHLKPLTEDLEGYRLVEQARDMAVVRLHGYLEDLGQRGSFVLIYVSEKAQR